MRKIFPERTLASYDCTVCAIKCVMFVCVRAAVIGLRCSICPALSVMLHIFLFIVVFVICVDYVKLAEHCK